jgi:hypothetical protein
MTILKRLSTPYFENGKFEINPRVVLTQNNPIF